MEHTQMKESDAPVYVLPRDINWLCPRIGEVAYVDAFGDFNYKPMPLVSITPHYVTFREGSRTGSIGWVEVKVSRIGTGLGFAFVFWRDKLGFLKCRLQEVEESFFNGKK